jgi:transforming growth factor-beta-induced protein
MFNKKSFFSISALLILALVLVACAPAVAPEPTPVPTEEPVEIVEPEPEPQTIVDIAVADGRFTTLVTALQEAELVDALSGEGPFTVFAPTDDAFAKLPEGTVEALLEDIPALSDILLYHVVSGAVLAEDVVMLESAETLLGESVEIKVDGGMVYINEAQVIITDIVASNGVIHVIDSVLLPPQEESLGTIVDIAVADGRFTTLVTALQEADLVEALSGEGPFTVFAPTDDAFALLPDGTIEALLADIPALTDILLYHVVPGEVLAADVVELQYAETLLEKDIEIRVKDGMVYLNDAQVIITDIMADNGVIHVIDSVLLPPESVGTIVDLAVADGRFTTLVTALQEADLVETLSGKGRFTVFAPTDDAFGRLPEGTIEALLADIPQLTDILLYHVVDGRVLAEDVLMLEEAETLLGENISIQIIDGRVFINEAEVIIVDIIADNGVIHVIDSVLLPPQPLGTIVDVAVEDGRFETLVTALTEADLVEALSGEGPFTVFAPTDDAFGKLPDGTIKALLADIPALTDILLYHVVEGEVLAEDVLMLEEAETLLGENVSIQVIDGRVFVNEAEVIIVDVMANNGVIHVIDSVLLPPEN